MISTSLWERNKFKSDISGLENEPHKPCPQCLFLPQKAREHLENCPDFGALLQHFKFQSKDKKHFDTKI